METSLPMFRAHAGCRGVLFGRRGESAVVITAWQDETAVRELDGSPRYRDVVDSINETGFLAGEAALQVFTPHGGYLDLAGEIG